MNERLWIAVCVCAVTACVQVEPEEQPAAHAQVARPSPANPAEPTCGDPDLTTAYEMTDASVHELVTCGGLQVELAKSMIGLVVFSNDAMFDETTRRQLADADEFIPKNAFDMIGPGRWQVQMGGGSTFEVTMFEPDGGSRITVDLFDMQSYLVGLQATYSMTFDEMTADPEAKNHWVFTWEAPGPLVHLLNGGERLPATFSLDLSLMDIAAVIYPGFFGELPDLGPFGSLLRIGMESEIRYRDNRESAIVDYVVQSARGEVGQIAELGSLSMNIDALTATFGSRQLVAADANLRFVDGLGLAGAVDFESGDDRVIMDFGDGVRYPTARWSCAE